jgi:CO/xanthine dehydrogenase Mo-binding subunit
MATDRLNVVGRSLPRLDGVEKVTGSARYITDLVLPGMVHARLWRSPVPHARILSVDVARAAAAPGIRAVCTAVDLPVKKLYYGAAFKDQPILAHELIRYAGEPVVAVVADSEADAEAALRLIDVRYEELPAVTTVEEALAPEAPLLHSNLTSAGHFRDLSGLNPVSGTNICHHYHLERGDLAQGFAEADLMVEDLFRVPAVSHFSLEPHCSVARAEPEGLTVWTGTQHPFPVRKELADIFGLPLAQVQVIVPMIGGAFGSKCYTKLEPLAAALAIKVGRPVRLAVSLEESAKTISRHAAVCRLKTGVKRDGTLVARECVVDLDTGAYADIGPRVATKAGYRAPGPYRIPHLRVDARAVYTNNVPAGAYRGYGTPQVTWAYETQMDMIAERLGLDPLELRLRNLLKRGEEYNAGDTPIDGDLAEGLKQAAAAIDWGKRALDSPLGNGLACAMKDGGGTHSVSTAVVRIHADGSVSLLAGSVEMGQGTRTALAQIAAETLGLPLEAIVVGAPDTSLTPFDQGTSASRSTVLMGLAVHAAASDARAQLLALAAGLFGTEPVDLSIREGKIAHGGKTLTIAEVIAGHFGLVGGEVAGVGTYVPSEWGATYFWEPGMGGAVVEVDTETGEVKLKKYVSAADVGQAVNPRECEAQDEGAAMLAIGPALFESRVTEHGQLLNPGLIDYRLPTFAELPPEFESILIENGDGPGPFGSKGIGESGTFCVAAAIGNALARALGIRLRELPMNPERVWRALWERRRS